MKCENEFCENRSSIYTSGCIFYDKHNISNCDYKRKYDMYKKKCLIKALKLENFAEDTTVFPKRMLIDLLRETAEFLKGESDERILQNKRR